MNNKRREKWFPQDWMYTCSRRIKCVSVRTWCEWLVLVEWVSSTGRRWTTLQRELGYLWKRPRPHRLGIYAAHKSKTVNQTSNDFTGAVIQQKSTHHSVHTKTKLSPFYNSQESKPKQSERVVSPCTLRGDLPAYIVHIYSTVCCYFSGHIQYSTEPSQEFPHFKGNSTSASVIWPKWKQCLDRIKFSVSVILNHPGHVDPKTSGYEEKHGPANSF